MDRIQRLTKVLLYCDLRAATKISHICKDARTIFFKIGLAHYFRHMTPCEAVATYVKYYQHLPTQGSPDWVAAKKNTKHVVIGGSELATVLGINPYQNLAALTASKLGRSTFSGSMATYWGNTFEPVLFAVSDDILGCERYETGSVPGLRRAIDGQYITAYSPDGLAVVGLRRVIGRATESLVVMRELLSRPKLPAKITKTAVEAAVKETVAAIQYMQCMIEYGDSDDLEVVALFEGKCPIGRIAHGFVPGHYKPQIWMGACTIPIVKICIFTDGMFRRCTLRQWHLDNCFYDKAFHYAWYAQPVQPKRIGFIGVFAPDNAYANEYNMADNAAKTDILAAIRVNLTDLGAASAAGLEIVLKNVVSHRTDDPLNAKADGTNYFAYYPPVNDQDNLAAIDTFVKWSADNGHRAIGVLPWKLLNIIHTPVVPNPLYMENNRAVIEAVVADIQHEGTIPWTPAVQTVADVSVDTVLKTDVVSADIFSDVIFEMADSADILTIDMPKRRRSALKSTPSTDLFSDIF